METYIILNLVFLAAVATPLLLLRAVTLRAPVLTTLAILLVLTAVFDSFIIMADIVAYDHEKLLGIYIGAAPIEDFFYSVLAALMIPALWNILGKRKQDENTQTTV